MTTKTFVPFIKSELVCLNRPSIISIASPPAYYEAVLGYIASAKTNITFSALYLGNGAKEVALVQGIEKALADPTRKSLSVTFILDHSRAQRGANNSVTMLEALVQKYYPRLKLYLYQMPQLRNVLSSRMPGQIRETLGVYHCKYNLFDDDVILTGANLSHDYFTDRQDRYMVIKPSASCSSSNKKACGSISAYLRAFTASIVQDCHMVSVASGTNKNIIHEPTRSDPSKIIADMKVFIEQNENCCLSASPSLSSSEHSENVVRAYPLIQHASVGCRQEETMICNAVLSDRWRSDSVQQASYGDHRARKNRAGTINIATPYANFDDSLMRALLMSGSNGVAVNITHPSLQAHGFGGATGLKGLIPKLHRCCLENSITSCRAALKDEKTTKKGSSFSSSSSVCTNEEFTPSMRQFSRGNWTFHSKGIWFYPPAAAVLVKNLPVNLLKVDNPSTTTTDTEPRTALPTACYIGSSNFGSRSWQRDFELGFILSSTSEEFGRVFYEDYNTLARWSTAEEEQYDGSNKVVESSNNSPNEETEEGSSAPFLSSSHRNTQNATTIVHGTELSIFEKIWLPCIARLIKSFL